MSKDQLRLVKFLPALIFVLASLVCIMGGWRIGTSGVLSLRLGLLSPGDYVAEGGIRGELLGLILGGFLSFGSFGMVTGWIWRKRYSNLTPDHSLSLVLGWMLIPVFILLVTHHSCNTCRLC